MFIHLFLPLSQPPHPFLGAFIFSVSTASLSSLFHPHFFSQRWTLSASLFHLLLHRFQSSYLSAVNNFSELECYNWIVEDICSVRVPENLGLQVLKVTINEKSFFHFSSCPCSLFFIFLVTLPHSLTSHLF